MKPQPPKARKKAGIEKHHDFFTETRTRYRCWEEQGSKTATMSAYATKKNVQERTTPDLV